MKTRSLLLILFLLPFCLFQAQEKTVKKSFKVNPYQRVFINGVSSIELKINAWEKNEGDINVRVKVNSSDTQFGKDYLQNFDVTCKADGNDLIIDFVETPKQGSWSVFDIFKGDFKYSFSKQITGEIYLPKNASLVGDFKYSDITVSGLSEAMIIKGKGNHLAVKDCKKLNEVTNEYGDVVISNSSGKLDADLKLSPLTIDDFTGQVKIKNYGATLNINRVTGSVNLNSYNSRGTIENISEGTAIYSEISELTVKNVKGFLQIYDKSGFIKVNEVTGFKIEGNKTDLTADRINAEETDKIFLITKYGNYKISNSTGSFYIDDDYSNYTFSSVKGNIFYSAANSKFTGNDLKADWKSDTKYSDIFLNEISASKLEAVGRGKLFKGVISNNPKKVEIKNEDADVSLSLKKDIKTSIFLTAQHGNLSSEFAIHTYKDGSASKAAERINGGGAVVSVETKNGNITIRKK